MDYLMKMDDFKLYICDENQMKIYDTTIQKHLNEILKMSLTNLTSR